MPDNKQNQGQQGTKQGNQGDQGGKNQEGKNQGHQQQSGQGNRQQGNQGQGKGQSGRSTADDRGGQGISNRPDDQEEAIPELDEPDVEGVGNEGWDRRPAEPDPTGTNPRRGNK